MRKVILVFLVVNFIAAFVIAEMKYGQLNVIASYGKYKIYVDGEEGGMTPLKLEKIIAGTHQLVLVDTNTFEKVYDKTITIAAGEVTTIVPDDEMPQQPIKTYDYEARPKKYKDDTSQWLKYQAEKKDPWIAAAIPLLFISSVGHAYAGDWGRGLLFLGGKLLCGILMTQTEYYGYYSTRPTTTAQAAAIGWLILYIWEPIDAFQVAEQYNDRLKNELGLSLAPNQGGLSLKLSYHF